jgi:uncharacterized protein (TIGR03000 family)
MDRFLGAVRSENVVHLKRKTRQLVESEPMHFHLSPPSMTRYTMALTIGTVFFCGAAHAQSSWGSLGGSYGGSMGGGSSGYVASYGSYGSHGSAGSTGRSFTPVRSLLRGIHDHFSNAFHRHHGRRASYASYGSTGYASTGYGSSGFGSGGYGSSGYTTSYGSHGGGSSGGGSYGSVGSSVSYGSVGTSLSEYRSGVSDHSASYAQYETDGLSGSSFSSSLISSAAMASDDDSVLLTVSLPSEASVFVNGKATASTGSLRQFVSRGLIPGKTYKFDVRAELKSVEGQLVTEEQTVIVRAGRQEHLQFAFSSSPIAIETSLTLNVPEGATVTLAGNSTRATGVQRVFHSKNLKVGEVWDDYAVEVEFNGQMKSQVIRLIGGDQLELSFQFDDQPVDQIASKS